MRISVVNGNGCSNSYPLVGDRLMMTRNEVAILGRRMTSPELALTAHELPPPGASFWNNVSKTARFTLLEKGREST